MKFLTRKLITPADLNPRGTLHGGQLLKWIDEEGGIHACLELQTGLIVTKYISEIQYDLIWSVEFLEHVEEKYIDNYIDAFKSGKYVICTHAQPGQAGHHHVNCKPKSYWIDLFAKHGLFYSEEFTNQMKESSTMGKPFIKRNGLFFKQWPS